MSVVATVRGALAFLARWKGRFPGWRVELAMLVLVALFSLTIRLLRLEEIETGSDAYQRWHFARQWFYAIDVSQITWDHHKARAGVNVPMFLAQAVLGRHPLVYYVVAVGCALGIALAGYGVARLLSGRLAGVLAVLLLAFAPNAHRMGSQVNPEAFAALYALLSLLALFRYQATGGGRFGWAALSSLFLFWGYLAKETAVFFVPAALVGTWLCGRRWQHAFGYAGVQLALLACESLFYALVSPHSSRFSVISHTHGSYRPVTVPNLWALFNRYIKLDADYQTLLGLGLLAAIGFLLAKRRDARYLSTVAFPLSLFALMTFAIRSIDPVTPWFRFLSRYLDIGLPFAALLVALAGGELARLLEAHVGRLIARRSWLRSRWLASLRERLRPDLARWAAPVLTLCLFGAIGAAELAANPVSDDHAIYRTLRYRRVLTDAYRRGIPIVAPGRNGYHAIGAAFTLYVEDDLLAVDGRLPDFERIFTKTFTTLQRSPAADLPARCRVVLSVRGRRISMRPSEPLDDRCG